MSTAEQKAELHKIVEAANEGETAKIIHLIQGLEIRVPEFSAEDLAEFEKRSKEHELNPASGIPWEESLDRLKSKFKR